MMRGKSICKVLKALLQPYLSNSHSLITNSPFSLNSPNASSLLQAVSRKKADRKIPNVLNARFIKLSYYLLLIALECSYEEDSATAPLLNNIHKRTIGMELTFTIDNIGSFHRVVFLIKQLIKETRN